MKKKHKAKIDELQCLLNKSEEALTNVRALLNQSNQEVSAYQTNLNAAKERNNTLQNQFSRKRINYTKTVNKNFHDSMGLWAQFKEYWTTFDRGKCCTCRWKNSVSPSQMLNDRETIGIS